MGHAISGFVARESEIKELVSEYKQAYIISLPQGFTFVPLTEELYDEIMKDQEFMPDICDERFRYLSSKLFQVGRKFSEKTPVAYIETDYFGGAGFQCAVAWNDGDVEFGPVVAGREKGIQIDKNYSDPINRALMKIGVRGYLMEDENEHPKDEFDEIGLGRYRYNEDWIESVK